MGHSFVITRLTDRDSLSGNSLLMVVLLLSGCATMGTLTNLSDESCRVSFTQQLSGILSHEGESPDVSTTLASKTAFTLMTYDLGPRPFVVVAPSGTDYRFFIERKATDCVLTLYGRRKGFVSYRNNLTYIATKILPGCTCAE